MAAAHYFVQMQVFAAAEKSAPPKKQQKGRSDRKNEGFYGN